jgi:hypothetical protein
MKSVVIMLAAASSGVAVALYAVNLERLANLIRRAFRLPVRAPAEDDGTL